MDRAGSSRSGGVLHYRSGGSRGVVHTSKSEFASSNDNGRNASSMENYINQVWLNNILKPLAPSITPALFHHMQQKSNLPNHFNPLLATIREDLSFFTPIEQIVEYPLFSLWISHANHPMNSPHIPVEGEAIEVAMDEELPLSFTEIANLERVGLMLFPEMEDEKYIFNCPLNLKKCSIVFLPQFTAQATKMAVVLSPTLRTQTKGVMNNINLYLTNHSNAIIVWTIRVAHSESFMRNLKKIIRNHNPCILALLETRLQEHTTLKDELKFSNLFEVLAVGHSDGIVLLWHDNLVKVNQVRNSNQELHAWFK